MHIAEFQAGLKPAMSWADELDVTDSGAGGAQCECPFSTGTLHWLCHVNAPVAAVCAACAAAEDRHGVLWHFAGAHHSASPQQSHQNHHSSSE